MILYHVPGKDVITANFISCLQTHLSFRSSLLSFVYFCSIVVVLSSVNLHFDLWIGSDLQTTTTSTEKPTTTVTPSKCFIKSCRFITILTFHQTHFMLLCLNSMAMRKNFFTKLFHVQEHKSINS